MDENFPISGTFGRMKGEEAESLPVLIIGAGLAGLSCALKLHRAGIPVRVLEASDGVGGRVRTDHVDGYLLDRGFQVYLSAYPEAGRLLNLEELDLHPFEPGAMVFDGKKLHRVMDVFRKPSALLESAFAPVGSVMDKLRVALLRFRALGSADEEIAGRPDQRTEDFLKRRGFSGGMIDGFFRAFYGGIFLERELRTSSRMFEFTFKMFSQGSATLPAKGMGEIALQLARQLPAETIRVDAVVASVSGEGCRLVGGEEVRGSRVVVATQASQTGKLIPEFERQAPEWRSVTNLYYSSSKSPLAEPIIALNAGGEGLVNNVCVLSDVAPSYAPPGRALISVSVLGLHPDAGLPDQVREELGAWFGEQVEEWIHLRTDLIKHALPEQLPEAGELKKETVLKMGDVWICGDHTSSASIEGAIISGSQTAEKIVADLAR
ncbi:NAD(P)/FAD-dependent oxidoreductase [Haloferula sp.]|uniref:NAD(P)/FAD-dependent oxidoreductase n=1 Tax=Haloferula sp. TaxID=2497595 RepID=UPI003C73C15B